MDWMRVSGWYCAKNINLANLIRFSTDEKLFFVINYSKTANNFIKNGNRPTGEEVPQLSSP